MTAEAIVDNLLEGDCVPGFDCPVVYEITFTWQGTVYHRRVETARNDKIRLDWAIRRAISSVLRRKGVFGLKMNHEIAALQPYVHVKNVSRTIQPGAPHFIPRWM